MLRTTLLAIAASVPTRVAAQVLSLEDTLAQAERASPAVLAAEADVDAARAHERYAAVPVIGNPIVGVRAMIGVPDDPAAIYAGYIGIPFDVSSRSRLWTEETDLRIEEAEAQLDVVRNEVRAEAFRRHVALALASESRQIAERRATLSRDLLAATEERMALESSTALDVALARQEAAVADADHLAAMRAEEQAREALREVLGLDVDARLAVESVGAPSVPGSLDRDEAIALAREGRREAAAARLTTARLEVSEDRLWAEAVAPLVVSAEYELQGNSQRNQTFGFGASIALPLFSMNDGDRAVATSEAAAARLDAEIAERRIEREAAAALSRLHLVLRELEVLDQEALPAAADSVSRTEALLEAGSVDLFRLLLARRTSFELEARRIELLRDAWFARAEVSRALGLEEAP